jgi:type I restriction enzyme S subunit
MMETMNEIDQKTNTFETRSNILTPKLRFKGFEGEWKESELGKLASKITVGIATEVRPFVSDKKDVPLLRNQNIKAGYFDDSSMEYIIPKFDEANKNKRVQSKDVIIVRTGSNMGNACVVPERFKGSQTFTTLIVRPISNSLNSDFLSYHINYFGLSEIQRLSAGGGKPNLNAGFLKSYRINVGEKTEQQKIASFLSAVDEKIQLLIRKKELLEQYKKGVMQQLFSGELRFKDENGEDFPDWEEKRLGEVGDIVTGKTPNTSDLNLWNGNIQFVTPTDINNHKYQFKTQRTIKELTSTRLLPSKSIMFTCIASIGKMSMSIKPCITNQQINSIVPFKDFDNEFIYYSVLNIADLIKSTQSTTTLPIINKTEFSKFKISVPTSYQEQQKIATFLSGIDIKIESVANQITQTQSFKKGLLQQLFV